MYGTGTAYLYLPAKAYSHIGKMSPKGVIFEFEWLVG